MDSSAFTSDAEKLVDFEALFRSNYKRLSIRLSSRSFVSSRRRGRVKFRDRLKEVCIGREPSLSWLIRIASFELANAERKARRIRQSRPRSQSTSKRLRLSKECCAKVFKGNREHVAGVFGSLAIFFWYNKGFNFVVIDRATSRRSCMIGWLRNNFDNRAFGKFTCSTTREGRIPMS